MTLVTIDEAARELNVPRASFSPHPRRTFAPDSPRLRDAMVSMGELVRIEGGLPAARLAGRAGRLPCRACGVRQHLDRPHGESRFRFRPQGEGRANTGHR